MWVLDYKESWALKNWCFWTVVLEKTLGRPLDYKGIQPVNPKGNQSWIFIGKTDAEAEASILWPPDAKSQLIGKDPNAGKYWRQKEKEAARDGMFEWHHWLNGHESEQTPGDSEGQGSLACCSPWSCKESDMTEQLNNNNRNGGKVGRKKSLRVSLIWELCFSWVQWHTKSPAHGPLKQVVFRLVFSH